MAKVLLHELGKSASFGRLSLKSKVLWPMLLASTDDQGRGLAEPDVISWFVCSNVKEIDIDTAEILMQELAEQEMVHLYLDRRGRRLYQVIRWWEWQALRWARPSRFDAPDGWTDRLRYNAKGNVYTEDNWTQAGGFNPSVNPGAAGLNTRVGTRVYTQVPEAPHSNNITELNSTELNQTESNSTSTPTEPDPQSSTAKTDGGVANSKAKTAHNLEKLESLGVNPVVAATLAASMAPADVQGWTQYAESASGLNNPAGFVVKMLQERAPPPEPEADGDWRRFIEGDYADFVEE